MLGFRANFPFWATLRSHLNFFRIHLLFFTFTPVIFSGILYASNGRYPIAYIDALYNSVSAVTVCGLVTVNLSQLTPWQQVLLFIQMCMGSPVVISWFMVYIRRHFFAKKFEYIIRAQSARSHAPAQAEESHSLTHATGRRKLSWRVTSLLRRRNGLSPVVEEYTSEDGSSTSKGKDKRLRTDMIRRMNAPPQRIDPNGWISEGTAVPLRRLSSKIGGSGQEKEHSTEQLSSPTRSGPIAAQVLSTEPESIFKHPRREDATPVNVGAASESSQSTTIGLGASNPSTPQSNPGQSVPTATGMSRTTTIEFAPTVTRHYVPLTTAPNRYGDGTQVSSIEEHHRRQPSHSSSRIYPNIGGQSQVSLPRSSLHNIPQSIIDDTGTGPAPETDFGGFPMPHKMLGMLFWRLFPRTANRLRRTMTVPTTTALSGGELGRLASILGGERKDTIVPKDSKPVPYISFDVVVGRNSTFHMLTNEQLEELGGVEYRGLNALLWLVALYHIGIQLVAFVVIAPYMAMPRWAQNFVPPAQIRPVASPWFSLFQVISSYTNTGFSLVDQSMVPFQTAYPMMFFMVYLILAGNTGFPIFLRFMIWIISKLTPTRSRLYETLRFLLDHPRRCFVYLFPSHQTWFLFAILVLLNSIDYFCFMVLDIGNPEIESIPLGTRFVAGLLQAIDVRASGFAVVPVAALAPAVKVMYVIMMYISVYPIAMSVRSTNVYEERSLGIFRSDDQLSVAEQAFQTNESRMAMWGHYLAMHARYQLSFDMWWLALALFLVCIIEEDNLINPQNQGWFNIFTILFEIVSAYGSVGLSLGIPTQNYSLSGAFRPLSKLIVCLVMIRGRHRGLPVAIDRAIVLPYEFERAEDDPNPPSKPDERPSARYSTGATAQPVGKAAEDAEHGTSIAERGLRRVSEGEVSERGGS